MTKKRRESRVEVEEEVQMPEENEQAEESMPMEQTAAYQSTQSPIERRISERKKVLYKHLKEVRKDAMAVWHDLKALLVAEGEMIRHMAKEARARWMRRGERMAEGAKA